jgi:hypothetical protein
MISFRFVSAMFLSCKLNERSFRNIDHRGPGCNIPFSAAGTAEVFLSLLLFPSGGSWYNGSVVDIVQPDARSVLVRSVEMSFLLPYRFHWNGQERVPESVVLDGCEVSAFFLAATIKDVIRRDARGILVRRSWSVKTPGPVRLSIPIEFDDAESFSFLFPAVLGDIRAPRQRHAFLQERMAYPCGLFLYRGENGVLVYAEEPQPEPTPEPPSIALETVPLEDEPARLRVEISLPGREEPVSRTGPKPSHAVTRPESSLVSAGTLERSFLLRIVLEPRRQVHGRGFLSVAAPLPKTGRRAPALRSLADLRQAVRECAATHLCHEGGVFGLRESPGSGRLSAEAGVQMARLLLALFPGDGNLEDAALRLADFALKGQHPTGLFYESYHLEAGAWHGVRGRRGQPMLSIARASGIAEALLCLAEEMEARGGDARRFAAAARRFVEFFFPGKGAFLQPGSLHMAGERVPEERGLERFAFFAPLWKVYLDGKRDKHKKALDAMAKDFSLLPRDASVLAASRPGRDPDSSTALLEARVFLWMRRAGYRMDGADALVSRLAPWVNVNRSGGIRTIDPVGGLADSFRRQRLLFAGNETAYLLLSLRPLLKEPWLADAAARMAGLCLRFSSQARLGTAWVQHTLWDAGGRPEERRGVTGPVDSRRLASEGAYLLRLHLDRVGRR